MIQAIRDSTTSPSPNYIRLDLFSNLDHTAANVDTFKPLIGYTSQETNKTKYFLPTTLTKTYQSRYWEIYYTIKNSSSEAPLTGSIYMGTKEYPYGFYNVKIWQQTSTTNLDPTDGSIVKVIWNGILNFSAKNNPSITYNEYEETSTSPVFITNTAI